MKEVNMEVGKLPPGVVVEGMTRSDKQFLPHGCNVGACAHELNQGI